MVTGANQTPQTFQKIEFRPDQLIPDRICASAERQLHTKFGGKLRRLCLRLSLMKPGPMEVTKVYRIY